MDSSAINQWVGNIFSVGAIVTTIMGLAPAFAALVALVWYLLQIYESATVQRWFATRRVRKLAQLKARVLMMEAQAKSALPGPEAGGSN